MIRILFTGPAQILDQKNNHAGWADEHTCLNVASISAAGKYIEFVYKEKVRRVKPRQIRIFIGDPPDVSLDFWFVRYGYQVDCYVENKPAFMECRDFSGSHHIGTIVKKTVELTQKLLDALRKDL